MVPVVAMENRRFGLTVVLSRAGSNHAGLARWHCICDCGTEFVREGSEIRRNGETCSCAACGYQRMAEGKTIHGETGEYLHTAWMGARRRVTDEKHPRFKDYGGRGITMYYKWQKDYASYRDYINAELGPRPSLDRTDNDKGYEPGNLRWATTEEQLSNRRKTPNK